MNELNSKSMLAYSAFGSSTPLDIVAKIDGGYQKLIEAIAGSLEDVHLNADVLLNRPIDASNEPAFLSYSDKNGMQHTYSCGKVRMCLFWCAYTVILKDQSKIQPIFGAL